MVPVGLQLFSLREIAQADLQKALEMTARAGYDCVEWYGCPAVVGDPAGAKAACDAAGLVSYSMHVPGDWLCEDALPRTLETLQMLGVSYAILPWSKADSAEACEETARLLARAKAYLAPHGIEVGYHNHGHEFKALPDGRLPMDVLVRDAGVLGEVDTCWALYGGVDPDAYIASLGAQTGPVHFKDINADYAARDPEKIDVPVGGGIIDFEKIARTLRAAGRLNAGLIVEQEAYAGDVQSDIAASCAHIREILKKIGA